MSFAQLKKFVLTLSINLDKENSNNFRKTTLDVSDGGGYRISVWAYLKSLRK